MDMTTWVNLEGIIPKKINRHDRTTSIWLHSQDGPGIGKFTETEGRIGVARGWDDAKVLQVNRDDGCTTMSMSFVPLILHLRWSKRHISCYIIFTTIKTWGKESLERLTLGIKRKWMPLTQYRTARLYLLQTSLIFASFPSRISSRPHAVALPWQVRRLKKNKLPKVTTKLGTWMRTRSLPFSFSSMTCISPLQGYEILTFCSKKRICVPNLSFMSLLSIQP